MYFKYKPKRVKIISPKSSEFEDAYQERLNATLQELEDSGCKVLSVQMQTNENRTQAFIVYSPAPEMPALPWATDDQIKNMVDRFLGWELPEDFAPDCGISFQKINSDPVGTNLFTADQAEAMIKYLLGRPC
jgi:hypothetical protein